MQQLYHYTPATGHGRWSPRSEVTDETIQVLAAALRTFVEDPPDKDTHPTVVLPGEWGIQQPMLTDTGAWTWALGRRGTLIVTCWLIQTEEQAAEVWSEVRHMAERCGCLAVSQCPALPCLAVVPVYEAPADRETWHAIADFERCVAWTLLTITIPTTPESEEP